MADISGNTFNKIGYFSKWNTLVHIGINSKISNALCYVGGHSKWSQWFFLAFITYESFNLAQ